MNKTLGILGYSILIISAAFLDIPFIGLLAMITFLAGVVLLLIFYLKLINVKEKYRLLFILLIVIGILTLSGTLGYSAIGFNEYLVSMHRGEELSHSPWIRLASIIGINVVSSFLIFAGIRNSDELNKETLYSCWLPTFFIIPVTIVLIKILEIIGAPLSA
jgi:hypothetical protein